MSFEEKSEAYKQGYNIGLKFGDRSPYLALYKTGSKEKMQEFNKGYLDGMRDAKK